MDVLISAIKIFDNTDIAIRREIQGTTFSSVV